MHNLRIFKSKEFGQVRTVTINNEPWFVGKDVASALGYTNANPDGSVKLTRTTKVTGKGQQYFINKFLKKTS